jgi:hypothetical protein
MDFLKQQRSSSSILHDYALAMRSILDFSQHQQLSTNDPQHIINMPCLHKGGSTTPGAMVTRVRCVQGEAVAQQQVNIAAGEVQRILQGQHQSRPGGAPPQGQPPMHSGPPQHPPQATGPPLYPSQQPPVRPNQGYPGQAGPPGGPGYPTQGPPSHPTYPGVAQPPVGPPQAQAPLVVPLYLGIDSAPGFDAALKVRGPGAPSGSLSRARESWCAREAV